MAPLVGTVPAFASGLVTGPGDIHVLSPNLASAWSYANGVTAIVHEFAHCASLRVNPSIANNPRWLWESVALYEAGQIRDPRTLPYLTGHRPPALADLNRIENTAIYEVGGLIGEFIVETGAAPRCGTSCGRRGATNRARRGRDPVREPMVGARERAARAVDRRDEDEAVSFWR